MTHRYMRLAMMMCTSNAMIAGSAALLADLSLDHVCALTGLAFGITMSVATIGSVVLGDRSRVGEHV